MALPMWLEYFTSTVAHSFAGVSMIDDQNNPFDRETRAIYPGDGQDKLERKANGLLWEALDIETRICCTDAGI